MTPTRPPRWAGVGCLVIAGVLGSAAFAMGGADGSELSAPPASLAVAPVTAPPFTGAPGSTPATPSTATPSSAAPQTTTGATPPLSPLAAMLGERTAATPTPPVATPPPVHLTIDALGVDVAVRPVGLEADGQLEIPDETEVGWYRLGASPGEPGAAVLAGHVNWHHVDGPFVRLAQLEPGAPVVVTLADGSTRTYTVTERQQYAKDAIPADRIWTHDGPETLVLITCGGSFNPDVRRYRDNIVVYAVPVA